MILQPLKMFLIDIGIGSILHARLQTADNDS